jgi:hypothetical protein
MVSVLAAPGIACECKVPTACELVARRTIFIGEVIEGGLQSLREDPWSNNVTRARFRVIENFKGLLPATKTVDVKLQPAHDMFAPTPYQKGRRYLVYLDGFPPNLAEGGCFSGRDVESQPELVNLVRDYFAGRMPTHIRGKAAALMSSTWPAPRMLAFFEAFPIWEKKWLEGAEVVASGGGSTFRTHTDSEGRYVLALPPGQYRVTARFPLHQPQPERQVSVQAGGCAVQNIGLAIDNTLSGRLLDSQGRTVKKAQVGLIDVDSPGKALALAYVKDDGSFLFRHVPLGRYHLKYNPNGPEPESPYESTYYPRGAASQADAKTIQIRSNGIHLLGMDLRIGPPVPFRQVTAKAVFPDGEPMTTAWVRFTCEPSCPEGKHVNHEGVARLDVPVNRKVRLEVLDWHLRDMKASYVSTHEPGSQPIHQTFTVSDTRSAAPAKGRP